MHAAVSVSVCLYVRVIGFMTLTLRTRDIENCDFHGTKHICRPFNKLVLIHTIYEAENYIDDGHFMDM